MHQQPRLASSRPNISMLILHSPLDTWPVSRHHNAISCLQNGPSGVSSSCLVLRSHIALWPADTLSEFPAWLPVHMSANIESPRAPLGPLSRPTGRITPRHSCHGRCEGQKRTLQADIVSFHGQSIKSFLRADEDGRDSSFYQPVQTYHLPQARRSSQRSTR